MLKGQKLKNGITVKCVCCGKEIHNVTKRKKFCSVRCIQKNRYVPHPRPRSEIRSCSYCGKSLRIMPHRLSRTRLFCDVEHMILFMKSVAHKETCIVCGKLYPCSKSQAIQRNRKTCSRKCFHTWRARECEKNRIKKGFTKHQIDRCIRYSKQADDWRIMVFKRDNYTCQECRVRGGYLEAHHIKPFAHFPELRFKVSNGLTLCRKCHDKTKIPYNKMRKIYEKEAKAVSH